MNDCIFCKIVAGEVPSKREKETEDFVVIHDIHPEAEIHLLIISKEHIEDIRGDSVGLWNKAGELAKEIVKEKSFKGFRLVHNAGEAALVKHMHIHLLGEVSTDRKI